MKDNNFTVEYTELTQHAQRCATQTQLYDASEAKMDCTTIVFDVNTKKFSEEYASYVGVDGVRCAYKQRRGGRAITIRTRNIIHAISHLDEHNFDRVIAGISALSSSSDADKVIGYMNVVHEIQSLLQQKFHLLHELTRAGNLYDGVKEACSPDLVNCIRIMTLRGRAGMHDSHCVAIDLLHIDTSVHNLLKYRFDAQPQNVSHINRTCDVFNMSMSHADGITYGAYAALPQQNNNLSAAIPSLFSYASYAVTAFGVCVTAFQWVRNMCMDFKANKKRQRDIRRRQNDTSLVRISHGVVNIVDTDYQTHDVNNDEIEDDIYVCGNELQTQIKSLSTHDENNVLLNHTEVSDALYAKTAVLDENTKEPQLVDVPEATMVDVPEATMVDVPEATMVDVPEATMVDVPEATMVDVPEATKKKTYITLCVPYF